MKKIKDTIAKIIPALDSTYNKDALSKWFSQAKQFIKARQKQLLTDGIPDDIISQALSGKNPGKLIMLQACAIPLLNKGYYEAFVAQLDPNVQKIWHELIWRERLDQDEIEKELGIKIYTMVESRYAHRGSGRTETQLLPEFDIFPCFTPQHYYYGTPTKYTLLFPLPLRQLLVAYYDKPDSAFLRPVGKIEPTKYTYENGEQDIALELPRVLTYKEQGQVVYTNKNRPAHTTLVKMQRSLNLREFFPNHASKKARTLRTAQIAAIAAYTPSISTELPQEVLKKFFRKTYPNTPTAPMTLPDLKGMGHLDDYYLNKAEEPFWAFFTALPSNAWISLENIEAHIKYNLLVFQPVDRSTASDKLYFEYEEENTSRYQDKHYIKDGYYPGAVEKAFVNGSFFLFAALGLCDLAYDDIDWEMMGRNHNSSWDGLRYVRRTPLGDYVCGKTDKYDASKLSGAKKITLSPDTLMIVTEEADNAAAAILDPYTERLGPNRFRVDSTIFLKNIRSKKELEGKMALFKQVIGTELPSNWQAFFKDILQKINPFESAGDLVVYKIPPDNKPLIQLIAQDPILKECVVKAEGFIILIPKDRFAAFKRRLQEFGYLLT